MKISHQYLSPFLLLFALCLMLSGCKPKHSVEDEGGASAAKATVAVKVAYVREGAAIVTATTYGKTDALHKEKVYAPIGGRILSLKVFEGSEVQKGDLIAVIQTKESYSAVLGAESMLKSATSAQQKTEAERALQLAQSTQKSVSVVAKSDGVVSTRNVSEGELVAENGEIVAIVDLSTIHFVADIPLRDLSLIRIGERASIRFQPMPETIFAASVVAINPNTDIQSQTVKVRLMFPSLTPAQRSLLRTDMMGSAQIVVGTRSHALFVPKAALLRNDEENSFSVMTMTHDSLARKIPVTVGVVTDSAAEVQSTELQAGSIVITEGNYALADSTRLTILQ